MIYTIKFQMYIDIRIKNLLLVVLWKKIGTSVKTFVQNKIKKICLK